jgi:hypothetical protein
VPAPPPMRTTSDTVKITGAAGLVFMVPFLSSAWVGALSG